MTHSTKIPQMCFEQVAKCCVSSRVLSKDQPYPAQERYGTLRMGWWGLGLPHLLVVLLEAQQLLLQGLHLGLQVRLAQGQLIEDPAQGIDVRLYKLPQAQLCLIPAHMAEVVGESKKKTFSRTLHGRPSQIHYILKVFEFFSKFPFWKGKNIPPCCVKRPISSLRSTEKVLVVSIWY